MEERKAKSALQKAAATKLWRKGVLRWKLDAAQEILDKEVMAKRGDKRMVLLCSRGWGKTYYGLIKLFEECLQKPNHHTAFVTLTKAQAKGNLRQSAEAILDDCPIDVRPDFIKNDAEYRFQNGSTLTLLGVDAERFTLIRGRAFHGVVVDETQAIDQLEEVVQTVLDPCVLRVKGWMLLTGTVPDSSEHAFLTYIHKADADGTLIKKTVYECPRYSAVDIQKAIEWTGGEDTDRWKREWLVELIFSSDRKVIKEWTPERAKELVRDVWPPPMYRDRYVGLDFAFSRDLTVALFGYLDFANDTLVIEDELALKPSTTAVMAEALRRKEEELWGQFGTVSVDRWADGNEARTIHEMRAVHKLQFKATDKKAKQQAINQVRMLISAGRLVVSPRCTLLIRTLMGATWDKNHKQFDRSEEIGHADALDALLYLSRNVKWTKNPVPPAGHWTDGGRPPPAPASSAVQALRGAFGGPDKSLRSEVNKRLGGRRRW